ncbi:indole-3-glycerol-phosphate synthase [Methylocella sp.]|uniref:indole-3-glycerol-phosphate synthase n=1 Tax=Methylocella sp. TaxID=1978226 RepID=UPI003783BF5F
MAETCHVPDIGRLPDLGPRVSGLVAQRRADVENAKKKRSGGSLTGAIGEAAKTVGFRAALYNHFAEKGRPGVIADIQGASPFTKVTRARLDVSDLAQDFHDAGAVCVSACQDRRLYRGSLADFGAARAADLPILANDLVVDLYQVIEARYAGADAVLLIAGVLGAALSDFVSRAESVMLDALVEVRSQGELALALDAGANLIAVNARDLETMEVDPSVFEALLPKIPPDRALAVAAGGLASLADVETVAALGAKAVRIGSALMAAPDPYVRLHEILGTEPDDLVED